MGHPGLRGVNDRILGNLRSMAPLRLADAWLWPRRVGRLEVKGLGPEALGSYLLTNPEAVRRHPRAYQHALSTQLSDHLLETVLRRLDVNVVLDVGANRGQFGRNLRNLGYRGRIVSYEPVSVNLAKLREAAEGDPDWLVEPLALGDVDSTTDIHVAAGAGALSSLLDSNEFGRKRFTNMRDEVAARETIQVRRLDAVCGRAVAGIDDPRLFLKLDTQGYDLQALAGAGDRLRDVVAMQSEVSCIPIYEGMPHLTQQIATYEEAGFAAAGMFPVSWDRETLAVIEFDVLMVRREVT
jgi:FkbM family methyltransferase